MKTSSYKDGLIGRLQKEEYAVKYLTEVLANEDQESFLIALNDVMKARKTNFTKISKQAGISRQGIYKALGKSGNPEFYTIAKILNALGLRLQIAIERVA